MQKLRTTSIYYLSVSVGQESGVAGCRQGVSWGFTQASPGEDLFPSSLVGLWPDSVSGVGPRTSAPPWLWARGHPQFFAKEQYIYPQNCTLPPSEGSRREQDRACPRWKPLSLSPNLGNDIHPLVPVLFTGSESLGPLSRVGRGAEQVAGCGARGERAGWGPA